MKTKLTVLMLLLALTLLPMQAAADGTTLYAAHASGELNIRDKPWGDRVGYLYPGDAVTYVKEENGWTQIECGIEEGGGWVKSEYLSEKLVQVELNEPGSYTNTSGGRANLRKAPNGSRVRWIEAGEAVYIREWTADSSGEQWGYTGDGYVAGSCLTAE